MKYEFDAKALEGQLEHFFTYHPPKEDQPERYKQLRQAGLEFAKKIIGLTPHCPDQTAAIRKIREAVMTANAAIACNE